MSFAPWPPHQAKNWAWVTFFFFLWWLVVGERVGGEWEGDGGERGSKEGRGGRGEGEERERGGRGEGEGRERGGRGEGGSRGGGGRVRARVGGGEGGAVRRGGRGGGRGKEEEAVRWRAWGSPWCVGGRAFMFWVVSGWHAKLTLTQHVGKREREKKRESECLFLVVSHVPCLCLSASSCDALVGTHTSRTAINSSRQDTAHFTRTEVSQR